MKLKIFGETIELKKVSRIGKFIGLMFKTSDTEALLFDFGEKTNAGIHSFFVFFKFYAVWLDDKKQIVKIEKIRPFTFLVKPGKKFRFLVEIPENQHYSKITKILDGKTERFKY